MPSSAATCVNGRPLPASSDTASRLNSSVNVRRVLLVIRAPRSLRSLSEVPTQPGEGQMANVARVDFLDEMLARVLAGGEQAEQPVASPGVGFSAFARRRRRT